MPEMRQGIFEKKRHRRHVQFLRLHSLARRGSKVQTIRALEAVALDLPLHMRLMHGPHARIHDVGNPVAFEDSFRLLALEA